MMPNPDDLRHPEVLDWLPWLAALAGLQLLLFLQQWWWQRRQFRGQALRRFGPGVSLWRGLLKWGLWTAAGWELLLALAVPLGPPQKIEGKQYGSDVIFCLDVSSSMLAQDVRPDRLQAAKNVLDGVINTLDGSRVGLVGFAGGAVVACPLTTDYDTASLFLDKLDVDSVPRDGTDLASAIQMALDGFGTDSARGKLIVLATDGEDTVNSDVLTEARRARELGVAVECVGVGTTEGALIPGQRDIFGRVYAKLWHGQPVHTHMDPEALERIAEASGGEYLPGDSAASLGRVAARIRRLKQGLGKAPDRYVRDPLFQAPLLWALALLLADSLISLRGRGWLRLGEGVARFLAKAWRPHRALVLLLGLSGLLALAASAHADLDNGRSAYNQGNDAYRDGDYPAAARDYQQAAQTGSLSEASDYNLGNALFQQKDYQGAISAYDQALKLNPDDQDAQYNRDLAQQMLDRKNQKPDKKNKKNNKNKQNNQNGGQNQQGGGQNQGNQQGGGQNQGNQQGGSRNQGNQQAGGNAPQNSGRQGSAQAQPSGNQAPPGPRLTRDQIETMLNQLRNDQRQYAGAFNPLKHYGRQDQQPQNPMQQMLQQFTGVPMGQPTPQPQQQNDPDYKDW